MTDQPCPRCGQTHARCTAHNRAGRPCQQSPQPGQTVCHLHGGRAPQAQKKAAERIETARQQRVMTDAVATLGLARDIDPAQALIEEVHWTAGHVAWLRQRVQELDEADLTWGMTKSKTGGDDRGDTFEAKPSIWYALYERERDRLVKVCEAAIKAGIAERQVRLAEQQGSLVASAIRQILDRLGLTPAQLELVPTVVPAVLRAISAQPAPPRTGDPA